MTSHFLTGLELNKAQALKLLSLAQTIKQQPKEFSQALAGQSQHTQQPGQREGRDLSRDGDPS